MQMRPALRIFRSRGDPVCCRLRAACRFVPRERDLCALCPAEAECRADDRDEDRNDEERDDEDRDEVRTDEERADVFREVETCPDEVFAGFRPRFPARAGSVLRPEFISASLRSARAAIWAFADLEVLVRRDVFCVLSISYRYTPLIKPHPGRRMKLTLHCLSCFHIQISPSA